MLMQLHHQKRRNFSDGTFVNIGEDGCPYAGDGLIIVADGLGGRGGFPHTKINANMLNREVFYRDFIEPVVGPADDNYARFVTDSFQELFELSDKYFISSATKRTSGYFASRLVTAIVLYEFKFNPQYSREAIFENILRTNGGTQEQYIRSLGDELANIIQTKLSAFAERMGLELESKTTGSYLLPTTLAIALTNETATGVDVLYLWAGDSRGYLWNANGLAQITDDHERDETMTNLITLTKPFRLETRLLTNLAKPLVLFNATDGCYKCPCFASPFDLEYVILQAINESKGFNEVRDNLDKQFAAIGTHDDSNTMALTAFGYEAFDALKIAVVQRLKCLQKNIIEKLPGILERDFEGELSRIDEQMEGSVYSMRGELIVVKPIAEFVEQRMIDDNYPPYMQELLELQQQLSRLEQSDDRRKNDILRWVQYYWLRKPCLKQYSRLGYDALSIELYSKIIEAESICSEERQRYISAHSAILENLNNYNFNILRMRDDILNLAAIGDKDKLAELSKNLNASIDALSKLETGILKGKNERIYARYYKSNSELTKLTQRYIEQDRDIIFAMAKQIISGEFRVGGMDMPEECRAAIESYLDALRVNAETRKEIQLGIDGLKDKHCMGYWTANLYELIVLIRNEHSEIIPKDLQGRIADNIGGLQQKRDELSRCLEVRNRLYEMYAQSYFRLFKESAL